jgi:Raf kinase inhibitor-like YbhB/YbcL family protein
MGRWITLLLLVALTGLPYPGKGKGKGKEGVRMVQIDLTSPAFHGGGAIPGTYTCDGRDVNPPLVIGPAPAGTRTLALLVDDPAGPVGIWVHWVLWNISPETREIHENSVPSGARQGRNDWHRAGYGGPCPPSGTHRYFFKLYALDTLLNLGPTTTKAELERSMQGHILGRGELMGTYRKR